MPSQKGYSAPEGDPRRDPRQKSCQKVFENLHFNIITQHLVLKLTTLKLIYRPRIEKLMFSPFFASFSRNQAFLAISQQLFVWFEQILMHTTVLINLKSYGLVR